MPKFYYLLYSALFVLSVQFGAVQIAVAFSLPQVFIPLGSQIGFDASFLLIVGWVTLAMLMVNEARSILENLVELGIKVPQFLVNGLAVTEKLINSKANNNESEDNNNHEN